MRRDSRQTRPNKTPSGHEGRVPLTAGVGALAAGLGIARAVHAAGSDLVRIALIGCGGRGTGAAYNALSTKANVRLVAMADAFQDYLDNSLRWLKANVADKQRLDVPPERQFVGLDAYQKAIAADVDMVLLCGPPGFRPRQFEAAVKAGKHVFMEKPVATDAPGIRRIMAANQEAKTKNLAVAVGHHLRHEVKHIEAIRRIHDGAIGNILYLRIYFNSSGVWKRPRQPGQTEMQHQVRNWYYFTWLSGDHIVEQHVHDIDVANWMMRDQHPVRANGMGGRQVRIGPDYGEIFDHHSVEFEYADGARCFSVCRHIPGCWESFSEHAHGTKGYVHIEGHGQAVLAVHGQPVMKWQRGPDGHQVEMDDLFGALAAGKPYNEADWAAAASMTAILGRMATYSGQVVHWDEALNSNLDLAPEQWTWDAQPKSLPGPDGIYPCAVPGVTKAL
ncbi:MAG: Gfo/Idh/MocA family protein [Thermoguttaceae bacterium]